MSQENKIFSAILLRLKQGLIFWKFEAQRPKNESGKKCSISKLFFEAAAAAESVVIDKTRETTFLDKMFLSRRKSSPSRFFDKKFLCPIFPRSIWFSKDIRHSDLCHSYFNESTGQDDDTSPNFWLVARWLLKSVFLV